MRCIDPDLDLRKNSENFVSSRSRNEAPIEVWILKYHAMWKHRAHNDKPVSSGRLIMFIYFFCSSGDLFEEKTAKLSYEIICGDSVKGQWSTSFVWSWTKSQDVIPSAPSRCVLAQSNVSTTPRSRKINVSWRRVILSRLYTRMQFLMEEGYL